MCHLVQHQQAAAQEYGWKRQQLCWPHCKRHSQEAVSECVHNLAAELAQVGCARLPHPAGMTWQLHRQHLHIVFHSAEQVTTLVTS
jgi:hypothetical protein